MRYHEKGFPPDGRRHWSESEARALLGALHRSGLSAAAFAKRRGVSPQRLRYWAQRLETPVSEPTAIEFLPVSFPASSPCPEAVIEIGVGDVVLRVREGLDVEHVARLVHALEGRSRC